MPRVGLEPTIPMFQLVKAFYALDREATVIGPSSSLLCKEFLKECLGNFDLK
jgi:hypothetical protein